MVLRRIQSTAPSGLAATHLESLLSYSTTGDQGEAGLGGGTICLLGTLQAGRAGLLVLVWA